MKICCVRWSGLIGSCRTNESDCFVETAEESEMKITTISFLSGLAFLAFCFSGNAVANDDKFSVIGAYGFDWLHPKSAKCIKITAPLSKTFRPCEYSRAAGFDGQTESYSCKVNARIEYVVFKDSKVCQQQFEVMQSNAP